MNKRGIIGLEEIASLVLILTVVLVFVLLFGFNSLVSNTIGKVFGEGTESVQERITSLSVDGNGGYVYAFSKVLIKDDILMSDLIVESVSKKDYVLLENKMKELFDDVYWELEIYDNVKGGNALVKLKKEGRVAKDWKTNFKEFVIPGYDSNSLKVNLKLTEGVLI